MPMPLAGVQALDLTSGVAGPYCTKILADYGADVIKVEPPQRGDVARQLDGAADDDATATAPLFLQLNTNKRSITLDITTDAGADVLRRLLRRVDLLVDDGALSTAADERRVDPRSPLSLQSTARDHLDLAVRTRRTARGLPRDRARALGAGRLELPDGRPRSRAAATRRSVHLIRRGALGRDGDADRAASRRA